MTNEERDIITQFIARVGGAPVPSGFSMGSVPATRPAPLPPVDRDADALIARMFQQFPEAAYRMTQLAFVQEQGLIQAQSRVRQLEAELQQARQAAQAAAQQPQSGGGFFSGLFGGNRQATPQPNQGAWGGQQPQAAPPPYAQPQPQPQFAPGYRPGMFQGGGSGFLGSALTTAAGVAGGMVVGNMLENMFSGGHHGGGWGAPAMQPQSPWTSPAAAPVDQNFVDSGTWDQPQGQTPGQDSSWTDNSGTWGSGDSGGGSDDDTF